MSQDQDLASTWEIRARTNSETGQPQPLTQAAPVLYVDDQPLLVLDPATVVEMQAAFKILRREQSGRAHTAAWLRRMRWWQAVSSWRHSRRHAARLWRARHPVLGLVMHGRTIALTPILILVIHGFVVTAGA